MENMGLCSSLSLYLFRESKTDFERSAYLDQLRNVKCRKRLVDTIKLIENV